jgi:hypothetical protein
MATKYVYQIDKIHQHLPLQVPAKFTQNGIFGLKICHLATLLGSGALKNTLSSQ